MGLLPTYQKAGILAGNRIRQVWRIYQPSTVAHTSYNYTPIHDDDDPDYKCVIDPGKRKVTGYNVSMAKPGELRVGDYTITVDNSSGKFYPGTATSIFTFPGGSPYYAQPQECLLEHEVHVWYDGAWREIAACGYTGRIVDIIYDDAGRPGEAVAGTATITTENNAVTELLRYEWTEEDGDDTDTGRNIYQET